ncbi:MAG TPA: DUF4238 domain-containing protein [Candidatus Saccharimonadales bacterium]|jgi:hypothetical protein
MAQHHFVPQTYLRGFAADDDEDRVYFYDRRIADKGVTKRLIEDVCSQNNLYRLLMDDGELKDDLEEEFATIAEPTFKEIVVKLLNREPLTLQEKSEFAAYISLQIMRTPASREVYNVMEAGLWDRVTKKEWERLLDDQEREKSFKKLYEETGVDVSALTKEHIQGIIDGTRFKTEWKVPKENWIKNTMGNMELVFRAFERMHWRIYFAAPGTAFITSDNPVGVLVSMPDGFSVGTGFLSRGSIRFFPLSKAACLTITDSEPSGFSFVEANKRRVQQINNVTAFSHHNVIISHNPQLLARCIKRVPKGFSLTEAIKEHHLEEIHMGMYD